MSKKAFPSDWHGTVGMDLRDYFAGQFVAGYSKKWEEIEERTFNEIAKQAYILADAMLKERSKE